jgi:hypothetical protein
MWRPVTTDAGGRSPGSGCKPRPERKVGGQDRTLALAEWVLVLSAPPPAVLPTATVLALYQVRWQVALVIKRWKSIVHIDHLHARGQHTGRHGKCSMLGCWSRESGDALSFAKSI